VPHLLENDITEFNLLRLCLQTKFTNKKRAAKAALSVREKEKKNIKIYVL
jgi:hypothetical protein